MTTRKNWTRKLFSCLLAFSFILAIGNVDAVEVQTSSEQQALREAEAYREIIIRDVPGCTWNENTTIFYTTPLYDMLGNEKGYIYEYVNGTTPVGFMQIDLSSDLPVIDSYSFEGEHSAAKAIRNLPMQIAQNMSLSKLVYMGGNSYLLLGSRDTVGNIAIYDVLRKECASVNYNSLHEMYVQNAANRYSAATRQSSSRSTSAATVYVTDYYGSGISFLSYDDTPPSAQTDCARISAVNACKYWAQCRGRRGLFSSNTTTYNAIAEYMGVQLNNISDETLYTGLYNYMRNSGYPPAVRGTIFFEDGYYDNGNVFQCWDEITSVIDMTIPLNLIYTDVYVASDGDIFTSQHVVLVVGYQHLGSNYLLFMADPYFTGVIYKSSVAMTAWNGGYSSYQGWRT